MNMLAWTRDMDTAKANGNKRAFEPPEGVSKEDFTQSFTRFIMMSQKPSAGTKYVGTGVSVGDANWPVFWFKPQDSQTYKVIYGDLRVEDVAEENLPATRPAEEAASQPATEPAQEENQQGNEVSALRRPPRRKIDNNRCSPNRSVMWLHR